MLLFFFKQKTAYEMRISDWSSDVCSSDLDESLLAVRSDAGGSDSVTSVSKPAEVADWTVDTTSDGSFTLYSASADRYLTTDPNDATLVLASDQEQIGRAACRERVCQYV